MGVRGGLPAEAGMVRSQKSRHHSHLHCCLKRLTHPFGLQQPYHAHGGEGPNPWSIECLHCHLLPVTTELTLLLCPQPSFRPTAVLSAAYKALPGVPRIPASFSARALQPH